MCAELHLRQRICRLVDAAADDDDNDDDDDSDDDKNKQDDIALISQ